MQLFLIPATPRSVYEYELFTSVHQIVTINMFGTYSSVNCTLSSWSISVPGTSNITITINSSTLTIRGWYEQVFEDDYLEYREARRTSSITRVHGFDSVPKNYFKATKYYPDQRAQLTAQITIVTDQGTINTTQVIKNNWDYKRTRLTDFIRNGVLNSADVFGDGSVMALPDLLGPLMWKLSSTATITAGTFNGTISTNQYNLNLRTWAFNNGWDGYQTAVITIAPNVYIYSTTTSLPALTVETGWPNGISIINNGYIVGKGGDGGSGPNLAQASAGGGGNPGGNGGTALEIFINCTITNNGTIGGGGGGGGSQGGPQLAGGTWYYTYGGAGGGGGAGFGSGGVKSPYSAGGVMDGQPGALLSGGNAGSGNAYNTGVAGSGTNPGTGSGGGGGGGLGANGGRGNSEVVNQIPGGGGGGAGGKAVNLNGYTINWLVTGTRLGTIS